MPNTTLAGHPAHPMLVTAPLGMFSFSFAMDVLHAVTGKHSYADAAYYSLVGGYVSGLAAGAAGAADYLTIPQDTKSKKVANLHGALNLGIMGLYSLNLTLRSRRRSGTGVVPFLMSAAGTAGLIASSWYGGELVYELGMRVKPVMKDDESPELKIPGDEKVEQGFRHFQEEYAPTSGGEK